MREFRPSIQRQIQPFIECIALALLILAFSIWMAELESGIIASSAFVFSGLFSLIRYRRKKHLLYAIEGERLHVGDITLDLSRIENIISVNSIGNNKFEFVFRDAIPVIIDISPLRKEDRIYITEFISARVKKLPERGN